jgi:HSP20 family protein
MSMDLWKKISHVLPWTKDGSAVSVHDLRGASRPSAEDLGEFLGGRLGLDWSGDIRLEEYHDVVSIELDVPGFDPKDMQVSVARNRILIDAERETRRGRRGASQWGRSSGRLHVDIPLASEVATAEATAGIKHGVLSVSLPKTEESRRRTHRIPVSS